MRRSPLLLVAGLLALGCRSSEPSGEPPPVPGAVALLVDATDLSSCDLAADEDGIAIAWSELRPGEDMERIGFARVTGTGEIDIAPRTVTMRDQRGFTRVRLVPTPSGYALWHVRQGDPFAVAALDRQGAVVADVLDAGHSLFSGRDEFAAGHGGDVQLIARVTGSGIQLFQYDDLGQEVGSRTDFTGPGSDPVILPRSDGAEVFWLRGTEVVRVRVGTDGAVLDTETVVHDGGAEGRRLAASDLGTGVLLSWHVEEGTGYSVRFFYLDDGGADWITETTLFGASRVDTIEVDHAGGGGTALIGYASDDDAVVPRAHTGGLEPRSSMAASFEALTPEGVVIGDIKVAVSGEDTAVLVLARIDGADQLLLRHR